MSDRRERILRAAREISETEGMHAVSVRHVAARAGVGASTLRYYFPAQQDLVDAVAAPTLDAQISDLRIADASLPAAERLTECMAQFLPPSADRIPQLQSWITAYAAAFGADDNARARSVLVALTARGRAHVERWLDVLDAEGSLRDGARPHAATILLAAVDGLCLELLVPGAPTGLDGARTALSIVVAGSVVR